MILIYTFVLIRESYCSTVSKREYKNSQKWSLKSIAKKKSIFGKNNWKSIYHL